MGALVIFLIQSLLAALGNYLAPWLPLIYWSDPGRQSRYRFAYHHGGRNAPGRGLTAGPAAISCFGGDPQTRRRSAMVAAVAVAVIYVVTIAIVPGDSGWRSITAIFVLSSSWAWPALAKMFAALLGEAGSLIPRLSGWRTSSSASSRLPIVGRSRSPPDFSVHRRGYWGVQRVRIKAVRHPSAPDHDRDRSNPHRARARDRSNGGRATAAPPGWLQAFTSPQMHDRSGTSAAGRPAVAARRGPDWFAPDADVVRPTAVCNRIEPARCRPRAGQHHRGVDGSVAQLLSSPRSPASCSPASRIRAQ